MYASPRQQQHDQGRDERQRQVDAICARMRPVRSRPLGATRPVWNECLQRMVEVR
jgi:hypothetical protein